MEGLQFKLHCGRFEFTLSFNGLIFLTNAANLRISLLKPTQITSSSPISNDTRCCVQADGTQVEKVRFYSEDHLRMAFNQEKKESESLDHGMRIAKELSAYYEQIKKKCRLTVQEDLETPQKAGQERWSSSSSTSYYYYYYCCRKQDRGSLPGRRLNPVGHIQDDGSASEYEDEVSQEDDHQSENRSSSCWKDLHRVGKTPEVDGSHTSRRNSHRRSDLELMPGVKRVCNQGRLDTNVRKRALKILDLLETAFPPCCFLDSPRILRPSFPSIIKKNPILTYPACFR